jgi:hypothetical protein
MTLPHIIMWAVIVLVGIPSAWRNPTSAALVLCWIIGETVFVLTGDSLPVRFYAYPDIFVIAVIMAKPEYCNRRPYRSVWHQLQCILLERSPADRVVLLIFPAMWVVYLLSDAALHPYYRWFALWFLVIVQILAAGVEALPLLHRHKAVSAKPDAPSFGDEYRRFIRVHAGHV